MSQIVDSDVSLDQLTKFLQRFWDERQIVTRIKVCGGEPTIHPEFTKAINMLIASPSIRKISIATFKTKQLMRRRYKFDVDYSCRPFPKTYHRPFFLSPVDLHLYQQNTIPACAEPDGRCMCQEINGIGFETWGFTTCAMSGVIGRMLGINPYHEHPPSNNDPNICRHCLYSLKKSIFIKQLREAAFRGEIKERTATFRNKTTDGTFEKWPCVGN